MSEIQSVEEGRGKRPTYLKVLCILTFVYTGLSLFSTLAKFALGPLSKKDMATELGRMQVEVDKMNELGSDFWVSFSESLMRYTEQANDNHYLAAILALIYTGLGVFGAIKMWQGEKLGFHLYIIYNILSIVSVYLYVSVSNVHALFVIGPLIVSLIFILMYSRNLKWMR